MPTILRSDIDNPAFRLALEGSPVGKILVNQTGAIVFINSRAVAMFRYQESELLGRGIEMLLPPEVRDKHLGYREAYLRLPEARSMGADRDLWGQRKDGSKIPLEIGLNPIPTEEGVFVLAAIIDISERVKAREVLAAHVQKLESLNEDLDRFAYIAAHDLSSPLRAIAQLSSWIEADLEAQAYDDVKENAHLLQSRVMRLQGMLSGLLEYSRAGRSEEIYEEIDVVDLVEGVIDLLLVPNTFQIEISGDRPSILFSRAMLQTIVQNLVANAIKHHDKKSGRISIRIAQTDQSVEISVEDDGPGIPEELQSRAFDLFMTLQSRDVKEGAGLGLAIVKKSIENVGGTVTLHSVPGQGSTFTVSVPLRASVQDSVQS